MFVPSCRFVAAALVLLVSLGDLESGLACGSTISGAPTTTTTAVQSTGTCEARTINYITDSLPQQCLRKEWNGFNSTGSRSSTVFETVNGADNTTIASAEATPTPIVSATATETAEESATDLENGELGDSSFLSFEEWKKLTLEKAGQANANIGNKKFGEGKKRESDNFRNDLDSLGDEGEIDLDFSSFRSGARGDDKNQIIYSEQNGSDEDSEKELGKRRDHRSKDAGKTCKERFSYASFDAGATILKTHQGAKNSKAILIENKDSYMLSICSTKNKFVIIELSEDIWIDTVVLANYEFFSSQIRTFRVSLSDRYPVKADKWKHVGTYEARNSREIQAFLIANPQIWARYIRIEFLSHYGNEYYCPLSLVRVHGTRMLESWKETEANNEEEDGDNENESEGEEAYVPEAVAEVVKEEEKLKAAEDLEKADAQNASNNRGSDQDNHLVDLPQLTTPWIRTNVFELAKSSWLEDVCLPGEAPIKKSAVTEPQNTINSSSTAPIDDSKSNSSSNPESSTSTIPTTTSVFGRKVQESSPSNSSTKAPSTPISVAASDPSTRDTSSFSTSTTTTSKSQNVTSASKNKTTSTSSASSSLPTIQESFFKAVSRRLTLLESNSTLSLKYIEEQSRTLREAFMKVEKKQLAKTNTFLDTLNSTVLEELRAVRQQYNEIWQSTIISLESQRDESRREILAVTSRLNILADEVVFQKRMSIVQSVLVLLCLGLVIFTHVSGGAPFDYANMNNRMRMMSGLGMESPIESPPQSPEYRRTNSMRTGRTWLEVDHRRQRSEEMSVGRSGGRGDESPATPMSAYSHSEEVEMTPPSGPDDVFVRTEAELPALPHEDLEVPESAKSVSTFFSTVASGGAGPQIPEEIIVTAPEIPQQSPERIPGRQKEYNRQQFSPPLSGAEDSSGFESPSTSDQSIPQLEFPEDTIQTPSPPQYTRTNSNLSFGQSAPPRLPSPPSELSLDSRMSSFSGANGNDIGIAIPMSNNSDKRHSMPLLSQTPSQTRISSSSPVQAPNSPPTKQQSSPTPKHVKRGSFSIVRKPLPALPPER